ncbi:unnamed protein product [Ilex paraguariensis]|uniref:Uncharacterized protein n=1 Tax=Ilex paraguariensis TaxID=185542 RepID=A0ABC8TNZ0_9AQUA
MLKIWHLTAQLRIFLTPPSERVPWERPNCIMLQSLWATLLQTLVWILFYVAEIKESFGLIRECLVDEKTFLGGQIHRHLCSDLVWDELLLMNVLNADISSVMKVMPRGEASLGLLAKSKRNDVQ